MTAIHLHSILAESIRERDSGFVQSSRRNSLWWRQSGEAIDLVELQKRSSEALYCVNLAVHYRFLPTQGVPRLAHRSELESVDCAFRARLTRSPSEYDAWWPDTLQSAQEIIDLLAVRGQEFFEARRSLECIAQVSPVQIIEESSALFARMPRASSLLLLARICEHLGRREACIEAATAGIHAAGPAVSVKVQCREILKRLQEVS